MRPFVLQPPGARPSLAKQLYDVAGTVLTILVLNYAVTPFMVLTIRNSFDAWSKLGYYGFWIIGGALLFFHAGGAKFLKSMHAKEVSNGHPVANGKADLKITPPNPNLSRPRGDKTPIVPEDPYVLPVDYAVEEVEKTMRR